MKNFKRVGKKAVLVLSATGASLVAASSQAAGLTDSISAATTSATADVTTAGGLIIGVVVAVAAVSWIRRVIR
jgi:hypothetical protein